RAVPDPRASRRETVAPTRTAPASARAETGSAASSSARPARPAHACTEARFRAAHAARTASSPPRQTQPAGRAPRPLAPATQPLPPSSPPLNDDRYRGHRSRRTDRTLQRANKVLLGGDSAHPCAFVRPKRALDRLVPQVLDLRPRHPLEEVRLRL